MSKAKMKKEEMRIKYDIVTGKYFVQHRYSSNEDWKICFMADSEAYAKSYISYTI